MAAMGSDEHRLATLEECGREHTRRLGEVEQQQREIAQGVKDIELSTARIEERLKKLPCDIHSQNISELTRKVYIIVGCALALQFIADKLWR